MKNIKPLGMRLLIKRSEAKTSKGGIILPDSAQETPKQGSVVAVGTGKMVNEGNLQKPELEVGDQVYFSAYAGTEVTLDGGEEHLLMNEDDVLCVVNS